MGKYTSSTRLITEKTLELFEHILDKRLLTRRLTITANHLLTEEQAKAVAPGEQLTIFDVPQTIAKKDAEEEALRMFADLPFLEIAELLSVATLEEAMGVISTQVEWI